MCELDFTALKLGKSKKGGGKKYKKSKGKVTAYFHRR